MTQPSTESSNSTTSDTPGAEAVLPTTKDTLENPGYVEIPKVELPDAKPTKQSKTEGFKEVAQDQPRGVNDKPVDRKRILVTGDQGFIASRLVHRLRSMGHDVFPFDILSGHDLLNRAAVEAAVKNVDIVYHIAAQADLTKMAASLDAGFAGVRVNVEATHNVAYACAKYKKWLIYASTVCVYGNQESHPENEDTTLPNPGEIYSCSKYAGEWLVRGYGYTFGMPWTSLRFATIYGEGMRPALGLHIFFRQAMNKEAITVHGDGTQDRTLTYVEDLVDGIVATLAHPEEAKGQVFNLTAPVAVTAKQMAQDVQKMVEEETGNVAPIVFIGQRPNQTFHEDFSVEKAKKLLGWEAKTSWKDGLKHTYEWMKTQI